MESRAERQPVFLAHSANNYHQLDWSHNSSKASVPDSQSPTTPITAPDGASAKKPESGGSVTSVNLIAIVS